MPASQLKDNKLFTDRKSSLDAAIFSPDTVTPANIARALAFPKPEDGVLRAYGVPRNLLVEYRLLSQPCSVVRDVTVSTCHKLDAASLRPSLDTRAILKLLRRFNQINGHFTRTIALRKDALFGKTTFRAGTPLFDLIHFAVETDQTSAPAVLQTVLSEVAHQEKYPVLLAVDDVQALYRRTTLYRDPQFQSIKPYHLSVPRLLLEYASGKKQFKRGAILGALSCSNTTFQTSLELQEALGLPHDPPPVRERRVPELVEYAQGLQNISVPAKLQLDEAATLYQVWGRDVALHSRTCHLHVSVIWPGH
ncbi:hypothetical protein EIP86_005594 [Pleurotus ostreatoroseus]|nr:hypothetical protein EIP86_005594 [Pleurotus ostreatoroseus]